MRRDAQARMARSAVPGRVSAVRGVTLAGVLRARDNDHSALTGGYELSEGRMWGERVLVGTRAQPLSVVIPAFEAAATLGPVLDALAVVQDVKLDVVVVDDASHDLTSRVAVRHGSAPTVLRLPRRVGPGDARNVGVALASAGTVLFVDADVIVSGAAVAEHAVRAMDGLVCLGLHHDVSVTVGGEPWSPTLELPEQVRLGWPDALEDARVYWRGERGFYPYSGLLLPGPVRVPVLDVTDDLNNLGHARWVYDFDLPRMVDAKLLSVRRRAFMDVGGFDPEFAAGWGYEDTFLGAKLIAAGLKVAPLRHSVGFHLVSGGLDRQGREGRRHAGLRERNRRRYWELVGGRAPRRDADLVHPAHQSVDPRWGADGVRVGGGGGVAVRSRAGKVARLRRELAALSAELELLRVWAAVQEARQARMEALAAVVEG